MVAGCFQSLAQQSAGLRSNRALAANEPLLVKHIPELTEKLTSIKAADVTVSGKVLDEKGTGLPGVSVVVKGTTQGATTDGEGSYRISAPNAKATLVFSFVGYQKQEVVIGNQTTLSITLVPDDQTLSEVVVVGYGSQRKQDITSAVSVINMRDIGEQPANNPNQILQGRAPGVVVKQKSGTPGGALKCGFGELAHWGAEVIRSMLSMGFR